MIAWVNYSIYISHVKIVERNFQFKHYWHDFFNSKLGFNNIHYQKRDISAVLAIHPGLSSMNTWLGEDGHFCIWQNSRLIKAVSHLKSSDTTAVTAGKNSSLDLLFV